jgi:hypothetical protein
MDQLSGGNPQHPWLTNKSSINVKHFFVFFFSYFQNMVRLLMIIMVEKLFFLTSHSLTFHWMNVSSYNIKVEKQHLEWIYCKPTTFTETFLLFSLQLLSHNNSNLELLWTTVVEFEFWVIGMLTWLSHIWILYIWCVVSNMCNIKKVIISESKWIIIDTLFAKKCEVKKNFTSIHKHKRESKSRFVAFKSDALLLFYTLLSCLDWKSFRCWLTVCIEFELLYIFYIFDTFSSSE